MSVYNRYNASILCVASTQDDVELYRAIKLALKTIPNLDVKFINLDVWQDGSTGRTREFDETGNEILPEENEEQ